MAAGLKRVDLRYCLLWVIGVSTGLRISDLLTLKTSHLLSSWITLTEGKTKSFRSIELKPEIYDFYIGYTYLSQLKPDDYLFHSSRKGSPIKNKPMTRQWATRVIGRVARENRQDFIFSHSMRKTYACRLFASSGSVKAVQTNLGHKYMSTTLIYLKDLLES
jgi:integrase